MTSPKLHRQEVILAESSPNAGDGCGLVSDGMYVVAVYVEDVNGNLALQWTNGFGWQIVWWYVQRLAW